MLTAIGVSSLTGVTTLAIHVRLDGAAVSGHHILDFWSNLDDLDAQLVPWNPGVTKKREFSEIATVVRSADSYTTNGNEHFVGGGLFWLSDVYQAKVLGFFQLNRFHGRETFSTHEETSLSDPQNNRK
jgi:hypothetical protein